MAGRVNLSLLRRLEPVKEGLSHYRPPGAPGVSVTSDDVTSLRVSVLYPDDIRHHLYSQEKTHVLSLKAEKEPHVGVITPWPGESAQTNRSIMCNLSISISDGVCCLRIQFEFLESFAQ